MSKTEATEEGRVSAIEKALELLLLFLPDNRRLSNTEISAMTGWHRATTSRTLHYLESYGFLTQDKLTRRFSLGPRIAELNRALISSLEGNFVAAVQPVLSWLRDATKLTVTLETYDRSAGQSVLASKLEGNAAIRFGGVIGSVIPWNTSTGLRAMLAYEPIEAIRPFLHKPMPQYTGYTVVTEEEFLRRLAFVREHGFSYMENERFMGCNALGVPVFDTRRRPIAAICVIGSEYDVKKEDEALVARLLEAGEKADKLLCAQD